MIFHCLYWSKLKTVSNMLLRYYQKVLIRDRTFGQRNIKLAFWVFLWNDELWVNFWVTIAKPAILVLLYPHLAHLMIYFQDSSLKRLTILWHASICSSLTFECCEGVGLSPAILIVNLKILELSKTFQVLLEQLAWNQRIKSAHKHSSAVLLIH